MRVIPLGVGDAFDPDQANSSALVEESGFTLLIDCGHSAVTPLWRARPDPETIDAVYLTHQHADHVLGLPSVMDRWSWEGRRKELLILTTERGESQLRQICALLEIAPRFRLHYLRAAETPSLGPFALRTAPTLHLVPNDAVQLTARGRCFAYSGDGRPTEAARALYARADLLMHECWVPDPAPEVDFHSDLDTVRSIRGPSRIGLYHIRAGRREAMQAAIHDDARLFVPCAGTVLDV
jgi:ribonuclease BN (tRNA processing enzyme)